jgi:hypothetical protein
MTYSSCFLFINLQQIRVKARRNILYKVNISTRRTTVLRKMRISEKYDTMVYNVIEFAQVSVWPGRHYHHLKIPDGNEIFISRGDVGIDGNENFTPKEEVAIIGVRNLKFHR